jgi:hypothetical protein
VRCRDMQIPSAQRRNHLPSLTENGLAPWLEPGGAILPAPPRAAQFFPGYGIRFALLQRERLR